MSKLERLRQLAASEEGKDLNSLKMLLRVCDAYRDLMINYAMFDAGRFGVKITPEMLKNVTNHANEKLEEMLG